MAGRTTRNDGESSTSSEAVGIPTGLNRIKTRITTTANDHHHHHHHHILTSNNYHSKSITSRFKQNQRSFTKGFVKLHSSREGLRKGKKIAQWFTSHLSKDSDSKSIRDKPPEAEKRNGEVKAFDKEALSGKQQKAGRATFGKQTEAGNLCVDKMPEVQKSFSHELGPKGGIRPSYNRAHSFSDLKELLRSLRSSFNAAKELVNTELACFKAEVIEVSQKSDTLSLEDQRSVEELLVLAEGCIEMSCHEFRTKCETIVQDLTKKRQDCQTGPLKWLFTRMLFILTRCTRLLHYEKHSEHIDEISLLKLKECLEKIPSYEMSWLLNLGIVESNSGDALNNKLDTEQKLLVQKEESVIPQESSCRSEVPVDISDSTVENHIMVTERWPHFEDSQVDVQQTRELEMNSSNNDLVICRICEESVPTSHLESHSYICAYAEKCDIKGSDVNESLLGLAEILDQIIESCTLSVHAADDSPQTQNSQMQISNSPSTFDGCSPKISEWRNKGVEGMFEDLHEMDTACIEDSTPASFVNLKGFPGVKLGQYGPPSSTGSMTSASSTNTPRAASFDFFWLEHNDPSELEDVQQMTDLRDIARSAAETDLMEESSHEVLLTCLQDLQDVLQHSKLKALVIDTFGHRIEKLIREKYIISCELEDANKRSSDVGYPSLLDTGSQSSSVSTPSHPLHKERTSIEDFEIIKPISRGAYGKVFLARKRTTGDLFAIKMLKKMDMLRKNDIERIVAERNILITVRNPFVVRFFYSFTSRDNLYLVMEYLNGGDLFSLLRNVGCIGEDVARIYIAELVLALEYLHSLGIVHRDLKPDNILIAHDGHIKLTDFGLSKIGLMNSTGDLTRPESNEEVIVSNDHRLENEWSIDRRERSAVGTPDYLAPEILLGTEHGYAADWWSVGVILFELVTGTPPFNSDHPERIFHNILNAKIPWPSIPNEMSNEAQDMINRFLNHDPNQRLGAHGSSEVKAHPFFRGVNWDTLAMQKVAFVPQPDSIDDTSYFVSRHSRSSSGTLDDQDCSDAASDTTEFCSDTREKMDVCGDLAEFEASPCDDLSWINFSFKNLSQLASINHDVLLQNSKEISRCSSPHNGRNS